MTSPRDAEFADYVAARLPSFRRLAVLLCQDWQRADDLVQAAITKLYANWPKAKAADSIDAYVRAIVAGTVKSQTAKALASLRRLIGSASGSDTDSRPSPVTGIALTEEPYERA